MFSFFFLLSLSACRVRPGVKWNMAACLCSEVRVAILELSRTGAGKVVCVVVVKTIRRHGLLGLALYRLVKLLHESH